MWRNRVLEGAVRQALRREPERLSEVCSQGHKQAKEKEEMAITLRTVPTTLVLLAASILAWQPGSHGIPTVDNTPKGDFRAHSRSIGQLPRFPVPDVGPVFIDEPWDTVWCMDTVSVAATVCNFGDTTLPFDVEAFIDTSGGLIYVDTQNVADLDPGACSTVYFVDWYVPEVEGVVPCLITITTLLPEDFTRRNDTLDKTVFIWCAAYHDLTVDYIDEPWDTVWCGDTSAVAASVCNYGDTVETFDVEAVIDSGGIVLYSDTQSVVDLEPDSCLRVDFAVWPVPGGHLASYTTTVAILDTGDMDPSNDTLRATSTNWCPAWQDISVDSITAPPDSVFCDSAVEVAAVVCNLGELAGTFNVEAMIVDTSGVPVYIDTVGVSGLPPDICVELDFLAWVVPATDSVLYNLTIAALLAFDDNPQNDTAAKTVFSRCQTTSVDEARPPRTSEALFELGKPIPNPAWGRVSIEYSLPCPSKASLRVYDLRGTIVSTLINGVASAGSGSAQWNGKDSDDRPVASGVYFYDFNALPLEAGFDPFRSGGKLILLR